MFYNCSHGGSLIVYRYEENVNEYYKLSFLSRYPDEVRLSVYKSTDRNGVWVAVKLW